MSGIPNLLFRYDTRILTNHPPIRVLTMEYRRKHFPIETGSLGAYDVLLGYYFWRERDRDSGRAGMISVLPHNGIALFSAFYLCSTITGLWLYAL